MLKTKILLNLALKAFEANNNKVVKDSDSKTNETIVNLSKNNISRQLMCVPNIRAI